LLWFDPLLCFLDILSGSPQPPEEERQSVQNSMRVILLSIWLTLYALDCGVSFGTTRYVWQDSPAPTSDYTSWDEAAHTIQDAVDVSLDGDEIIVTNGVYDTGGRAVFDIMTNRVVIDRAVLVRSVGGPDVTTIQGYQLPAVTNGEGAVRCVYLTSGATLIGFTLTNGATLDDSGFYNEGLCGGGVWCESTDAVVSNCVLIANACFGSGGAAFYGTLKDCTVAANAADTGGGVYYAILTNSTLIGNSAAHNGGGASYSTLNNCVISNNSAGYSGGGTDNGSLNSCSLSDNFAANGGAASSATLNNCTLTGNSASHGGGAKSSTLNNCILFYNVATVSSGSNYESSTLNYCCTAPMPGGGSGNITSDPQLASSSHLSASSPCRGAGSSSFASQSDIDGEPWASPPSIGCDEYRSGSITGALTVNIAGTWTAVAAGYPTDFRALITGRTSGSSWTFGDGATVSNRLYISHAWTAPGAYPVVLKSWNESNPGGISATTVVQVVSNTYTHYVAAANSSPVWPYLSWATAAKDIQDAVDAAEPGTQVLVSNGIYTAGGKVVYGSMSNRVVDTKQVLLRSVNGPQVTVIHGQQVPGTMNGDGAVRCVYLADGALLSGFTLTNGATRAAGDYIQEQSGGGVWCESPNVVVSNCVFTGNSAVSGAGAYLGTMNRCTFTGNSATSAGAGVVSGVLNNCKLVNNVESWAGAAYYCTLNNCTIVSNSPHGAVGGTLNNSILYYNGIDAWSDTWLAVNYCCTGNSQWGPGNMTNAPAFRDLAAGDLRLGSNSPCINSGNNSFVTDTFDFDGNPRMVSGTTDLGCYEFQDSASVLPYLWLQQNGLPTDGSADYIDTDGDGLNNWQEWFCKTDPNNAQSALRLTSLSLTATNVSVSWQSVGGISYNVERSTNLESGSFVALIRGYPGQNGTSTFTDSNPPSQGRCFYRISVGP
jgi:hypothetical protein